MKLLHTADWHIGRRLHGFDLTAEQQNAYAQIEQIAQEEQVDGMIIAGDLYDRRLPAETSVAMVDSMLQQLNLTDQIPIYAISGNHDSATRLATGTPWFKATHLYLHTDLSQAFQPVELSDTQLFLCPYFEPFDAQQYFSDDSLQHLDQAFERVVVEMKQHFDPTKKHVLVAHFFAAGSSTTDSETNLTVGGLAAVPTDLLTDFDYVALGHLHGKEALQSPTIRYSGSPVKFSLSEANQEKGVWIVDTAYDPVRLTFKPITPIHDVQQVTSSFAELMNPDDNDTVDHEDYVGITLTDKQPIPNVMARLRDVFPRIVTLGRTDGFETQVRYHGESSKQIRQKSPMDLLDDFYEKVAKESLSPQQEKWAKAALKVAREEGNQA
ncbi:exonuclease SbcCD subunit D [Lactobacillus sp. LC28-10]|uniref:Nuclease SbcCD subunit D n=1 Tax=Secundilactobacillus angelensis TaxID=2722706 RepID=A0ABX1KXW5_9LACO|nr:exonuclease SbcCD subunit D [Secundilactobacillus angelensis]MCH5462679.1 exonuclease SbcCD subunit D [Secundilactobacillus angelensis]NLR18791.1 exonuclease SbcCD subunit D [Secundilactobacillus angelensis]